MGGFGQRIITWSDTLRVWDAHTGEPLSAPMAHEGMIIGVEVNDDEQRILTWSKDGTARIWDIKTDFDFPHEYLELRLQIKTRRKISDMGDIEDLTDSEWQVQWQEYESIARAHLKKCRYPLANWYLIRQMQRLGSCERLVIG